MSRLRMSCPGVGSLTVNCTKFESPLTGNLASAQTKTKLQHFPVKASQPSFRMELHARSQEDAKKIQDFVRGHHLAAMPDASNPEVMLWWPEKGINNWSGFIKTLGAGAKRFEIAPRIQLEFLLINSLLSEKTFESSLADDFKELFGSDIGKYVDPADNDGLFTPPAKPRPGDPGFIGPVLQAPRGEGGTGGTVGGGGGSF